MSAEANVLVQTSLGVPLRSSFYSLASIRALFAIGKMTLANLFTALVQTSTVGYSFQALTSANLFDSMPSPLCHFFTKSQVLESNLFAAKLGTKCCRPVPLCEAASFFNSLPMFEYRNTKCPLHELNPLCRPAYRHLLKRPVAHCSTAIHFSSAPSCSSHTNERVPELSSLPLRQIDGVDSLPIDECTAANLLRLAASRFLQDCQEISALVDLFKLHAFHLTNDENQSYVVCMQSFQWCAATRIVTNQNTLAAHHLIRALGRYSHA